MLHPGFAGPASLAGASLLLEGMFGTLGPLQLPPQPTGAPLVLQHGNVGDLRSLTLTTASSGADQPTAEVHLGALSHAVAADRGAPEGAQPPTFVCQACLDGLQHSTHLLKRLRAGNEAVYQLRLTVARGPGPALEVPLQVLVLGTRGGGGVQQCVVPKHATVRVGIDGWRDWMHMVFLLA